MNMTGAQAVLECLKREGVDVVFGYPGGAVLSLYDEVYKAQFPHILTGHEQGAVHAADGYARVTGRPGVCFATSGLGSATWSRALQRPTWIYSLGYHQRSGSDAAHWPRLLSRGRYFRHYDADYEAQLSRKGRERTAAGFKRSLLHCVHRSAGTGPGRHC
mgnify:CR=1 FL=1